MSSRPRRWLLGAITAVAVIGIFGAGLWAMQRRLIYFPDDRGPEIGTMGAGWEELTYDTRDGLTHRAWYHAPEVRRPVVVVFNGNAGNRADRAPLGQALVNVGFGVLLTDYRGYGGNPGHPTEDGLARDGRAAARFVQEQVPASPIVYFGESLGAAVAIELAAAEPPAALVLRSPFTSLVDVGRVHYPWLPVSAMLKDRYPSLERIGSVTAPTLVIAGEADSIVPFDQSREIFEAAGNPTRLVSLPGADHNDAALTHGDSLIHEVVQFLALALGE